MIVEKILALLDKLINILPNKLVLLLGSFIGSLVYCLDKKHRYLALANINKVFGRGKGLQEKQTIARRSFQYLGMNLMGFLRGLPDNIKLEGTEQVKELLAQEKGMIFVIGHLGNWEIMGRVAVKQFAIKLVAVGRRIKNVSVDKFIKAKRTKWGIELVPKKGSLHSLLSALKEGKSVAILVDQYAGRKGVFVDFFGLPTSTIASPAILALRTGMPIFPVFMIREKDNSYKLEVTQSIPITNTGNVAGDIKDVTQKIAKRLESYVSRYPEQWWWVHRRWR